MKVLANLDLPKKTDANLPFGKTIQDETDTLQGTPIVADVLQDLFSNFYKLLELTGTAPTNQFDSNLTQYQIINALKKLPNTLNDVERVLTLEEETIWNIDIDFSLLPNKYFFFARASEDCVYGTSYSIKDAVGNEYDFTSDAFKTGCELLVIFDTDGVRAYPLSKKETLVYEAIYSQITTGDPSVNTIFKSEHNLVTEVTRSTAGFYRVGLSDYSNILVEVIPMGGVSDDNLNVPKIWYGETGIAIDYETTLDCNRTNAFYLKVTKKV